MGVAVLLMGLIGCEYDVSEPLWYKPLEESPIPHIADVQPSPGLPGVNTITITGENLGGVPDLNGVYFDTTPAEIIGKSTTEIVVRRPDLVADNSVIKVVSDSALVVAKFSYGKIDQVMVRYGDFRDNIALSIVTVDENEIVYVATTNRIWRVDLDGVTEAMTLTGQSLRTPNDGTFRNGILYLMAVNNRFIQQVYVQTGEVSAWVQMPPGKVVRFGDFDENGYFYAGGGTGATGTDLCIIPPDPPASLTLNDITLEGSYTTEEIQSIRVFNGNVYVVSRPLGTQTPSKFWRHTITGPGQLGARELFFDMATSNTFASRSIRSISFSQNGTVFITTDAPDPILVLYPGTNTLDYFYKNIVPPNGKHSYWGRSTYLYTVTNDPTNADIGLRWNIARIDIGMPGAPYY
jgi:hypothetical protein